MFRIIKVRNIPWQSLEVDVQPLEVRIKALENNKTLAEKCFYLKKPLYKSWFEPGANIMFLTNKELLDKGIINIISKYRVYPNSLERTNELLNRTSMFCLMQVYPINSTDDLTQASYSFVYREDGFIKHNLERDNFVTTGEEVKNNIHSSYPLVLHPLISIVERTSKNIQFNLLFKKENYDLDTRVNDYWNIYSTIGYLPIKQLKVVNGKTTFKLITKGIPEGTEGDIIVSNLSGHIFYTFHFIKTNDYSS